MAEVTIATVRLYHPLSGVLDDEIVKHLQSAIRDFADTSFGGDADREEAVCCQTIAYVAPILYAKGMKNFAEYETIFATYGDLDKFREVFFERAKSAANRGSSSPANKGKIKWAAV